MCPVVGVETTDSYPDSVAPEPAMTATSVHTEKGLKLAQNCIPEQDWLPMDMWKCLTPPVPGGCAWSVGSQEVGQGVPSLLCPLPEALKEDGRAAAVHRCCPPPWQPKSDLGFAMPISSSLASLLSPALAPPASLLIFQVQCAGCRLWTLLGPASLLLRPQHLPAHQSPASPPPQASLPAAEQYLFLKGSW